MGTNATGSSTDVRKAVVELDEAEHVELLRLLVAAIRVQQPGSPTDTLQRSLHIQLRASLATLTKRS